MSGRGWLWVESAAAGACCVLTVVTLVWRDWVEMLTGVDPDGHSGSVEWLVVAALTSATVGLSLLARREWRRIHPHTVGL